MATEEVSAKAKETIGMKSGKAKAKTEELKGEAMGKAHEVSISQGHRCVCCELTF